MISKHPLETHWASASLPCLDRYITLSMPFRPRLVISWLTLRKPTYKKGTSWVLQHCSIPRSCRLHRLYSHTCHAAFRRWTRLLESEGIPFTKCPNGLWQFWKDHEYFCTMARKQSCMTLGFYVKVNCGMHTRTEQHRRFFFGDSGYPAKSWLMTPSCLRRESKGATMPAIGELVC